MIPLPRWALPYLTDKKCPVCGSPTDAKHVEAIGIKQREPSTKKIDKGQALLIFEYRCPNCGEKTFWLADPDEPDLKPEELLQSILDAMAGSSKKSNKVSKSKITNKELKQIKLDLEQMVDHDEFLRYIGLDQGEIDRLKKVDGKNGNQDK